MTDGPVGPATPWSYRTAFAIGVAIGAVNVIHDWTSDYSQRSLDELIIGVLIVCVGCGLVLMAFAYGRNQLVRRRTNRAALLPAGPRQHSNGELQPAKRRTIRFRLIMSLAIVGAALWLFGDHRAGMGDPLASEMSYLWYSLAEIAGGSAAGVAFLSFIITGRAW